MADHKFPCLMFYLENQACADKFLRFLHENGIIPELIAEHQAGHSYAVATDDLDNALQHTASKASANSIGRPVLMSPLMPSLMSTTNRDSPLQRSWRGTESAVPPFTAD